MTRNQTPRQSDAETIRRRDNQTTRQSDDADAELDDDLKRRLTFSRSGISPPTLGYQSAAREPIADQMFGLTHFPAPSASMYVQFHDASSLSRISHQSAIRRSHWRAEEEKNEGGGVGAARAHARGGRVRWKGP